MGLGDSTNDYRFLSAEVFFVGLMFDLLFLSFDLDARYFIIPTIMAAVGLVGVIFIPVTTLCVHHIADAIREGYEEDEE